MNTLLNTLFACALILPTATQPTRAAQPNDTTKTTTQPHETPKEVRQSVALPEVGYENRTNRRSEFISYTIRDNSMAGDRAAEWNYLPVENFRIAEKAGGKVYERVVEFPSFWADRIIIMHTEGGRNSHKAYVNEKYAGSSRDSGTPSEFELKQGVLRGLNAVTIEVPADTREPESALSGNRPDIETWYLYSQPRTRIWDYSVSAEVTGADGEGELLVDIIVENDYSSEERFTVCMDIFSPAGQVEEYMAKEITMAGKSRDTVRIKATIYGANKRMWSAGKPNLYHMTLFIRRGGRIIEYVPVKVGFGKTAYSDGAIYRNGQKIELKPTRYNATTRAALRKDIAKLKKGGFNVLSPDYPQPFWFYDICDELGMYVIDQANINTSYETDNLRVGGSLSNDPAWLPEYMERTQAMYYRSHNHPCIIAWSLGGASGNGYNMYKTYLWLRNIDPTRAVVYRDAGEEWNTDIVLPTK